MENNDQEPTYVTADALAIAAALEPVMASMGYHVGIGGSLAYRGTSNKDIDIFIYPHSREVEMDLQRITAVLADQGYTRRRKPDDVEYDEKSTWVPDVWCTENHHRQRVDFFFLSRVTRCLPPLPDPLGDLDPELIF